ncbi:hypothetical protein BJV74DRAFT_888403 [Russula compacta]|nr:hypothetical protein BJV74DRAFT_888403 [Russula compacta]
MSDGASSFSAPSGSQLPDKPLVVKCKYNTHRQKLTFQSARNCTYDGLQQKIRKRFELTAPFVIQWEDDDGERNDIQDEISLSEAIDFYHSGTGDEVSVTSSGSVFSSRSSSRHPKITMLVQIRVDYDGPSLSDTASLASREEGSPEGSQLSFPLGDLPSLPQDDDAVTVSSKDTCALQVNRQDRTDSSLIKKLWNSTSRTASSSNPNKTPLKSSRSRIFNFASRASSAEGETTPGSVQDNRINGRSPSSLMDTEKQHPDDPSAVFARLRLNEQGDLSNERPNHSTGMDTWLKDQIALRKKATLAVVPSMSEDSFSLNTDSPFSDGDPEILLQMDERGKYYYNYTCSSSSESAGDLEYEVMNGFQPNNDTGAIPHHLLVPEEVTDCSECGRVLNQGRYICTTCGEKTPMSRDVLAAAAAAAGVGKGKSRASSDYYHEYATEYGSQETSPNTPAHLSNSKPLPALPSTSPTQTIFGRNLGSQSTLVPPSSSGSSTPTTHVGYELCDTCFGKVGLDHTLSGGMDSPSSPTLPPTPQELAIARRTAPKRKGDLRHAFLFQIWGFNGWQDIALKHPGVRCFNCEQDIVGARFRCVDCRTIDIDICSNCETAGLPGNLDASDGGHNSSHIMLKIPKPLEMHEVQHVSRRAQGLRHGRDRADLRGVSPLLRSSPSSISSVSAGTVLYSNESGAEIEEDYVHLQVCNSCAEPIVGVRYQCLNCPSLPNSFNLCSDCEVKSYRVHDPLHTFLKIPRPVDIPGPLESEFPIIPLLYRNPVGPVPGSPFADVSGDPTVPYLRDLTHDFALCDRHMMRIVGKWYRCAYCAKDLCADCEAIDTHDGTHVFLVFKAPVDMQAFRHFADLENSAGSPPVLRGNIYYRHDERYS